MRRRNWYLAMAATVCMLPAQAVAASKLDSFEDSALPAQREPEKNNKDEHRHAKDCSDKHDDSCSGDFSFFSLIFDVARFGGVYSYERLNPSGTMDPTGSGEDVLAVEPRHTGEPLIPFLRFDYAYQPYRADVSAHDYRLEAGYGPFALAVNKTHYVERNPDDSMDITRTYGAYRMSFGPLFEVDVGIGELTLTGNTEHTYSYFTMPFLIYADENYGIEFRPAWAGNINDYDTGVFINFSGTALKLGYREVETPTQSLNGYYLGFSARY